jgi:hypothetical protein
MVKWGKAHVAAAVRARIVEPSYADHGREFLAIIV